MGLGVLAVLSGGVVIAAGAATAATTAAGATAAATAAGATATAAGAAATASETVRFGVFSILSEGVVASAAATAPGATASATSLSISIGGCVAAAVESVGRALSVLISSPVDWITIGYDQYKAKNALTGDAEDVRESD
ncbi:ice-structuring protein 4-like isoform X2 [Bradysia coprophila]|uniref:ice-structuring protein 4-like isoform X2 n=1 Tax=Bradysia coprophila TaxID=38358 RepID=UPI00187DC821|nr:ice-structuring protein 4-like isoform X2 [Bradysia coprophila]